MSSRCPAGYRAPAKHGTCPSGTRRSRSKQREVARCCAKSRSRSPSKKSKSRAHFKGEKSKSRCSPGSHALEEGYLRCSVGSRRSAHDREDGRRCCTPHTTSRRSKTHKRVAT